MVADQKRYDELWEKERQKKIERERFDSERRKQSEELTLNAVNEQVAVLRERKLQEEKEEIEEGRRLVSLFSNDHSIT